MILLRKFQTFLVILRECKNWPTIVAGKLGFNKAQEVHLQNGLVIALGLPLRIPWGCVFEPAIADCYGIRQAQADVIVDVGTNLGAFSCLAAKTYPRARDLRFEPNPASNALAKINFKRNGLTNIHLTESPVTADGRDVTFHINKSWGSESAVLMGEDEKVPMASVTLAEVLRRGELGFFQARLRRCGGRIDRVDRQEPRLASPRCDPDLRVSPLVPATHRREH